MRPPTLGRLFGRLAHDKQFKAGGRIRTAHMQLKPQSAKNGRPAHRPKPAIEALNFPEVAALDARQVVNLKLA